jgi:hypothetical protein
MRSRITPSAGPTGCDATMVGARCRFGQPTFPRRPAMTRMRRFRPPDFPSAAPAARRPSACSFYCAATMRAAARSGNGAKRNTFWIGWVGRRSSRHKSVSAGALPWNPTWPIARASNTDPIRHHFDQRTQILARLGQPIEVSMPARRWLDCDRLAARQLLQPAFLMRGRCTGALVLRKCVGSTVCLRIMGSPDADTTAELFEFALIEGRSVAAAFDGGKITSGEFRVSYWVVSEG